MFRPADVPNAPGKPGWVTVPRGAVPFLGAGIGGDRPRLRLRVPATGAVRLSAISGRRGINP